MENNFEKINDEEISTEQQKYINWVNWHCHYAPYMLFDSELLREQIVGFTIFPNIKIRLKGVSLSNVINNFLLIHHFYYLKNDSFDSNINHKSEDNMTKKRKKNSLDNEIIDQYLENQYMLIGCVPVIIAYRKTDDEDENGILLYIDKISIQKHTPVNDNYENRLVITLCTSMITEYSYTYDSNIIETIEGERKIVLENINSFHRPTQFEFSELARIISPPFSIKKNINLLSNDIAMMRKELMALNPQKGRKRTNLSTTK